MSGQNIKGGVAIRGMNVTFEYQFPIAFTDQEAVAQPAPTAIYIPYLFALQDSLLIYKGTSIATLQ
jgi:hypothetical protein